MTTFDRRFNKVRKVTAKIDEKIILSCLERVTAYEEFAHSEVPRNLLKYLVTASLEGRAPKESEIAIDFFGRSSAFNANEDSVVRSHIYSIRKKLEKYYLTEGADDRIRLVIPKGRYEVRFEEVQCNEQPFPRNNRARRLAAGMLLLAAVSFSVFFFSQHLAQQKLDAKIGLSADHPMWKDIIQSNAPVRIVMGDYFAYMERGRKTLGDRRVRDGAINSEQELQAFLEQNPQERSNIADQRSWYLSSNLPSTLEILLPFLKLSCRSPVTITSASQLTETHLGGDNIIFIGPLKTLGLLHRYFEEIGLEIKYYPHRLIRSREQEKSFVRMSVNVAEDLLYERDYGLIIHLHPDKERHVIIMAAFSGYGVEETVRNALSEELAELMTDRLRGRQPSDDPDFYVLYQFNVIDGQMFSEVVDIDVIPQSRP